MFTFNHFNFNVFDLERSLKFYDEALGLKPVREKNAADGRYKIVFLGDGRSPFLLELTWLRDRTEPYDLGEQEYHLALAADDFPRGPGRLLDRDHPAQKVRLISCRTS